MPGAGRPRWGYHQLTEQWAARLVGAAGIQPGDLVLDVGAGTGVLTAAVLAAGGRVVAIELHPGRFRLLQERFGSAVTVVRADASDLRLPTRPFKVVANPPFSVATALVRRLVSPGSRMVSADLVLPAYAAARWAGGRGPGARRWSQVYEAGLVRRLPAAAFRPTAPMPTAVLRLERHGGGGADPHAPPSLIGRARQSPGRARSAPSAAG